MHQWFLLVGALLVAMAFGNSVVQRLCDSRRRCGISLSIALHGVPVTPLMTWYGAGGHDRC
jgi:hypothetical protein